MNASFPSGSSRPNTLVINAFVEAWNRGETPALKDHLPSDGKVDTLVELVHIELEYRWRHGKPIAIREYLQDFPHLKEHRQAVLGLIEAELRFARRYQSWLDREAYLATYAEYLPELEALLHRVSDASEVTAQLAVMPAFEQGETSRSVPANGTGTLRMLKHYELHEELGRGGMGVVYRARDTRLDRWVALKMVVHGDTSTDQLRRFLLEARASAQLRHPNIVQVYDIGDHDGAPYLAMELVNGSTLQKRIKGTPQPPADAAAILVILSRAIQTAHDAGIVHRDLKPGNILLQYARASQGILNSERAHASTLPQEEQSTQLEVNAEDGIDVSVRSEIKIADFGLAKQVDGEAGQTQTGQILGTPSYMAPEQARGDIHNVGPRADIYALGAILYELLTGQPPFRGTSAWETIRLVIEREPIPPSRLVSGIPRDLETICLKCLEKDPTRRYASAADLADDLDRFRDGRAVLARPISPLQQGWRWTRRNPYLAAAMAVSVLSILVGAIASLIFALKERQARQSASEKANELTISNTKLEATSKELFHAVEKLTKTSADLSREKTELQTTVRNLKRESARRDISEARSRIMQKDESHALLLIGRALGFAEAAEDRDLRDTCEKLILGWTGYAAQLDASFPMRLSPRRVDTSPDGAYLLCSEVDRRRDAHRITWVEAWDLRQRKPLSIGAPGSAPLAVSKDLQRVVQASAKGVALWANGKEIAELAGGNAVRRFEFISAGSRILGLDTGERMVQQPQGTPFLLWDAETGNCIYPERVAKGKPLPNWIGATRDEKIALILTAELTFTFLDLTTEKPIGAPLQQAGSRIENCYWSPQKNYVVSVGVDRSMRLWNPRTGTAISEVLPKLDRAWRKPLFSPDDHWLALEHPEGIEFLDMATGKPADSPMKLPAQPILGHFSPSGNAFYARLGKTGYLQTLPPSGAPILIEHSASPDTSWPLDNFTPDGRFLATVAGSSLFLSDARTGIRREEIQNEGTIKSLNWSPDGKYVVINAHRSTLWRIQPRERLGSFPGLTMYSYSAFSANSEWFAYEEKETPLRSVRVIHLPTAMPLALPLHRMSISSIDGPIFGFIGADRLWVCDQTIHAGMIRIWDLPRRPACRTLDVAGTPLTSAAAPNGQRFLTAYIPTPGNELSEWSFESGKPQGPVLMLPTEGRGVAYSRDGKMLFAHGKDRSIRHCNFIPWQWDRVNRTWIASHTQQLPLMRAPPGQSDETWSQISPDHRWYIEISPDREWIQFWDLQAGKAVGPQHKLPAPLEHLAFSINENRLLTVSSPGFRTGNTQQFQSIVWDLRQSKAIAPAIDSRIPLPMKYDHFFSPFSIDGKRIILPSGDGRRLYEAATMKPLGQPFPVAMYDYHAIVSTSGNVVFFQNEKEIRLWNIAESRLLGEAIRHGCEPIMAEKSLICVRAGECAFYDIDTGTALGQPLPIAGTSPNYRLSPDGRYLLIWASGAPLFKGTFVHLIDVVQRKQVTPPWKEDLFGMSVFSPCGRWLITQNRAKEVRLRALKTGHKVGKPLPISRFVDNIVFSHDGECAVVVETTPLAPSSKLWILHCPSGTVRHGPIEVSGWIRSIAAAPDGQRFAIMRAIDQPMARVQLHDANGSPLRTPFSVRNNELRLEFSSHPDYCLVYTGASGDYLSVYPLKEGMQLPPPLASVEASHGSLRDVAFSPTGTLAACVKVDGSIIFWDPRTGKAIGEPIRATGHADRITFAPDGHYLAVAIGVWDAKQPRGEIRFWDVHSRQWLASTPALPRKGLRLIWHPSLPRLLVESGNGRNQTPFVTLIDTAQMTVLAEALEGYSIATPTFDPIREHIWLRSASRLYQLNLNTGAVSDPFADSQDFGWVLREDGRRTLSQNEDGIVIRELPSGKPIGLPIPCEDVDSVHWKMFSPDGRFVITFGRTAIEVWDSNGSGQIGMPFTSVQPIKRVLVLDSGKRLLVQTTDRFQLWEISSTPGQSVEVLQERIHKSTGAKLDTIGNLRLLTGEQWNRP